MSKREIKYTEESSSDSEGDGHRNRRPRLTPAARAAQAEEDERAAAFGVAAALVSSAPAGTFAEPPEPSSPVYNPNSPAEEGEEEPNYMDGGYWLRRARAATTLAEAVFCAWHFAKCTGGDNELINGA
jgi:hypothetical protein